MSYVEPAGASDRRAPASAWLDERGNPNERLEPFWEQFRRMRDPLGREELLIAYRYVVDEVLAALPADGLASSELAALERRAVRGLGDAIERFPDGAALARFPEFALSRVHAAVDDGLQRLDLRPRTIVRRMPSTPARAAHGAARPGERPPGEGGSWPSFEHAAAARGASRAAHPAAAAAAARREEERAPFRALARTVGLHVPDAAPLGEADPADRVRAALRLLPEQQRTVLTLQYLAGLSLEQVGALLGTSLIGARRASELALSTLRRSIEEDAGPLAAQAG